MKHPITTFYTRISLALSVAVALLPSAVSAALQPNTQDPDDHNGVLYVHGTLRESPCRLAMSSAWQEVVLDLATGELQRPGDETTAVAVQIKLEDCIRHAGRAHVTRTGTFVWGGQQPLATVSFLAPADEQNLRLVKVTGAKGFGLRIVDQQQRPIILGSRSTPLFLSPGENQLTYYISAQRTQASLEAGPWQSLIGFRLNYD